MKIEKHFEDSDSIDHNGMLICKDCDLKFDSKEELELH